MDDFELPVKYKDQELTYPGHFRRWGYSYRIELEVDGFIIYFEPDEERNWRAMMDPEQKNTPSISRDKVLAIMDALNQHLG